MFRILFESDINLALFGLGLSHGVTSGLAYKDFLTQRDLQEQMYRVATRLAFIGNGHNKFLESIQVWIDITFPRHCWVDFDTYRVGITKQSEATNHTLLKRPVTKQDFSSDNIPECILTELNTRIQNKDILGAKDILPESFLQRRIVCTNYKTLQNIVMQRRHHKLPPLRAFCEFLKNELMHPEFIARD